MASAQTGGVRRLFPILLLAALAGCDLQNYSSGTVRGRVVTAAGIPVANARVMLDDANGRATLTNYRGEFRLGGAADGGHALYALDVSGQYAAAASVTVEDGAATDAGDLVLTDCAGVLAGAGSPEGPISDGSSPTTPGEPGADVSVPCSAEPPPPPPANFSFASLTATYADGFVDPSMIYVFGEDVGQGVTFDLYVLGDYSGTGGARTVHVDPSQNFADAHVGLFVTYEQWGYYYVLRSGDLSVTVAEDGDGDPATLGYQVGGTSLAFDLVGWDGSYDAGHTATVGSLAAEGIAAQYIPPPPPPSDITIPTFTPDWVDLILCDLCAPDGGDALFAYAYDSANGADLQFLAPLSTLATPGVTSLLAANGAYGSASVYTPDGGWYYTLVQIDVNVASSAVTLGTTLSITFSSGDFLYQFAGGPVVVTPDGNTQEPPPGSEPQYHLYLTGGDLSAVVQEWKQSDPSGGSGTAPPPGP